MFARILTGFVTGALAGVLHASVLGFLGLLAVVHWEQILPVLLSILLHVWRGLAWLAVNGFQLFWYAILSIGAVISIIVGWLATTIGDRYQQWKDGLNQPPTSSTQVEQPRTVAPLSQPSQPVARLGSHGSDSAGRKYEMEFALITTDCLWTHNASTDVVCFDKSNPPKRMPFEPILAEATSHFRNAQQLIVIGTASRDRDPRTLPRNEVLAASRVRQLGQWIREREQFQKEITLFNFGQFTAIRCPRCSESDPSWQRPIIIAGIYFQDRSIDVPSALEDALKKHPTRLPQREWYSRYDIIAPSE